MPTNRFFATVALIAAVGLSGIDATPAEGQLANASAASLGLSGNNTATARGFSAISVNPAGLGMPGSGFSLALMGVQGRSGLDPLKLSDFNDVAGTLMSAAVKDNWLSRIDAAGGLSGSFGAEVSEIALTMGNFGLQVSTVVGGSVTLPTGIAEAMLYGNAGRTGSPTDLSLSGASIDGFAISTAGLSLAFPMSSPSGDMAIGATFKYSVGHGVAVGRSTAGSVQSNPIRVDVDFPIVLTSEAADFANGGKGIGLDLGFMMKQGNLSFGASIQNAVNTFAWEEGELAYRPIDVEFEQSTSSAETDEQAYAGAPATLKALVTAMTIKPSLQVGAALDLSDDLTISGDLHNRFSDGGIAFTPKFHLGAGAEFRGLKVIHLRGGAAIITDGIQYSGGLSLVLGPVNLSAAAAVQTGDLGENFLGQFTFSLGNR